MCVCVHLWFDYAVDKGNASQFWGGSQITCGTLQSPRTFTEVVLPPVKCSNIRNNSSHSSSSNDTWNRTSGQEFHTSFKKNKIRYVPLTALSKKYQNKNESIRFCLENIQLNITFFRDGFKLKKSPNALFYFGKKFALNRLPCLISKGRLKTSVISFF